MACIFHHSGTTFDPTGLTFKGMIQIDVGNGVQADLVKPPHRSSG